MESLLSQSDEERNSDVHNLELKEAASQRSATKRSNEKYSLTVIILAGIVTLVAVGYMLDDASDGGLYFGPSKNLVAPSAHEERRLLHAESQISHNFSPQKLSADMDNSRVLNVHAVPHTHDDVGWLKTVDQYYYGLNNTIQLVSVKNILDTVVASLLEQENRTFTYVESKFFSMWWNEQTDSVKDYSISFGCR